MIRRPKGSRRRRWHELREKRGRGIVLLPSLLTTGNLFCGFFALLLTVEGRFSDAALAIFVAMVMDLLDGRVARLMKATSQFAVAAGVLALLMVSTFRYWSFKEVDFVRRRPLQTLLVVVLAIMIVATKHDVFLFMLFTGYALSGPVRRLVVGRPLATPTELASKES